MKDGKTKMVERSVEPGRFDSYLVDHRVTLIIEQGPSQGEEHVLESNKVVVGRGPGVDFVVADDAMSSEHVAFELQSDGFRARDLGSTNGMRVNGAEVLMADLKHGDSIEVGNAVLRYLVEPMSGVRRTHVIPD
jgi:pSer/pThr/pTyr-binding forkhead associated (FHA) protein